MRKFIGTTATAALVSAGLLAAPALAADLPPAPEPVPVSAPDWTGFYIGGHAGYAWNRVKDGFDCGGGESYWVFVHEPGQPAVDSCSVLVEPLGYGSIDNPALGNIVYPFGEDPDGWLAGLQIGYNYHMGNFVIGAEVSGSAGAMSATRHFYFECGDDCFGSGRYDINWVVTAVGKLGWAMDRWMIAAEGGLALVNTSNSNSLGFDDDGVTDAGWTVGGSVEFKLTDTITTFAKYNYINVDDVEHLGTSWVLFPTAFGTELEMHVLKVGFNKIFQ